MFNYFNKQKANLELLISVNDQSNLKNIQTAFDRGQIYLTNEQTTKKENKKKFFFFNHTYTTITNTEKLVVSYNKKSYVFNFEETYDTILERPIHNLSYEKELKKDFNDPSGNICISKPYKNAIKKFI